MALDEETLEYARALMRFAREHNLAELSLESPAGSISIRRGRPEPPPTSVVAVAPAPAAPDLSNLDQLCSPVVGVFYRSPSPEAPPYVAVGDVIRRGQTVGLIEAMKVFNEIVSEYDGRVVTICVENGELVQAGAALMLIEPSGGR